jgi:hypothetical protein
VSFAASGLSGITNQDAYSYLRETTAGTYPTFLSSDWDVGLRDGFEDGDASDLVVQVGSYVRAVTSNQAALGQFSYTLTGGSSHSEGSTIARPFGQPSYISFRFRVDATSNTRGYFVFRDATDSNGIIFFACAGPTMTLFEAGTMGTCQPNTWHHVEFRNLNWTSRTYDAYLDGVLSLSGRSFRGTGTQGARIDLYNYFESSQAWWDEIIVKP